MNPSAVDEQSTPHAAFIFHTAFCCSTLLARCLGQPDRTFLLLEPLALRDLADAQRQAGVDAKTVATVLRLLLKPLRGQPAVLIKPSNLVNNLIPVLLESRPTARAVVITCGLRAFLVSCLKKPPETQQKMPWLLATVSHGSDLLARLGVGDPARLSYLQMCALVWFAHRVQLSEATQPQLRWLRMEDFLSDRARTLALAVEHLGVRSPDADHVQGCLKRNAKEPGLRYGPERRRAETRRILERFGPAIDQAIGWYESHAAPRLDYSMPPELAEPVATSGS